MPRNLLKPAAQRSMLNLSGFGFQKLSKIYFQCHCKPSQQHDGDISDTRFQLAEVAFRHIGVDRKRTTREAPLFPQFTRATTDLLQKFSIVALESDGYRL